MFIPTPETKTSTHYFFYHGRNFGQDDETITTFMHENLKQAFLEDVVGLEAMESLLAAHDGEDFHEVSVASDQVSVAMLLYGVFAALHDRMPQLAWLTPRPVVERDYINTLGGKESLIVSLDAGGVERLIQDAVGDRRDDFERLGMTAMVFRSQHVPVGPGGQSLAPGRFTGRGAGHKFSCGTPTGNYRKECWHGFSFP